MTLSMNFIKKEELQSPLFFLEFELSFASSYQKGFRIVRAEVSRSQNLCMIKYLLNLLLWMHFEHQRQTTPVYRSHKLPVQMHSNIRSIRA